ncbi:MAG: hypothetical protein IPN17_32840 [Deltaproteobacteria bacterium]|nr:hypothetical protein [Deltaproteobacteria bacterium]
MFRYVMRHAGSLRVSTANRAPRPPSTPPSPCSRCAPAANPRDFFCNNDDPTATAASRNRFASRVATAALPAGAVVHIAVGGLASTAALPGRVVQGAFELTVEEVAPHRRGRPLRPPAAHRSLRPGAHLRGPHPRRRRRLVPPRRHRPRDLLRQRRLRGWPRLRHHHQPLLPHAAPACPARPGHPPPAASP